MRRSDIARGSGELIQVNQRARKRQVVGGGALLLEEGETRHTVSTEDREALHRELEAFGLKRFVAVGEEDYDAGRLPRPSPEW